MLNKFLTEMKEEGKEKVPMDQLESLAPWEQSLLKRALRMESKVRLMKNQWTKQGVTYRNIVSSQWKLGKEQSRWADATNARVSVFLITTFIFFLIVYFIF